MSVYRLRCVSSSYTSSFTSSFIPLFTPSFARCGIISPFLTHSIPSSHSLTSSFVQVYSLLLLRLSLPPTFPFIYSSLLPSSLAYQPFFFLHLSSSYASFSLPPRHPLFFLPLPSSFPYTLHLSLSPWHFPPPTLFSNPPSLAPSFSLRAGHHFSYFIPTTFLLHPLPAAMSSLSSVAVLMVTTKHKAPPQHLNTSTSSPTPLAWHVPWCCLAGGGGGGGGGGAVVSKLSFTVYVSNGCWRQLLSSLHVSGLHTHAARLFQPPLAHLPLCFLSPCLSSLHQSLLTR